MGYGEYGAKEVVQRPFGEGYAVETGRASQADLVPFAIQVGERLAALHDLVSGLAGVLGALRERKFGPWPADAEQAGGPSTDPRKLPECDAELFSLDTLIAMAKRADQHGRVLSALL